MKVLLKIILFFQVKENVIYVRATLCPTPRLDVMSHAVDCVFFSSNHTTRVFCRDFHYTTREFYGNSPEIHNLQRVTSRLISKLDRD